MRGPRTAPQAFAVTVLSQFLVRLRIAVNVDRVGEATGLSDRCRIGGLCVGWVSRDEILVSMTQEYPKATTLPARDIGRLLLRCADRPGLVAAISGFLTGVGANI